MSGQMSLFVDVSAAAPRLRESPAVPKYPTAEGEIPCRVCGSRLMVDVGVGRVKCHFCERERSAFQGLACVHPEFGEVHIIGGSRNGEKIVCAWHQPSPGGWAVLAHDDFPELGSIDEYRDHLRGLADRGVIDLRA